MKVTSILELRTLFEIEDRRMRFADMLREMHQMHLEGITLEMVQHHEDQAVKSAIQTNNAIKELIAGQFTPEPGRTIVETEDLIALLTGKKMPFKEHEALRRRLNIALYGTENAST